MNIQDLVTIVVPVHNGEQFLRENIESILCQTHTNLEIIYICDGCTDKTEEILQEYKRDNERLIVHVEKENHGAAVSRNIGRDMAKGEWIIFLDSDDLFEADMIETMLEQAVKENADICCCYMNFFDDKPVLGIYTENQKLKWYCETYPVINVAEYRGYNLQLVDTSVWTKLIHRNVYKKEQVAFQDIPNCNDVFFSFSVAMEAQKIVYVNRILVHYRSNEGRKTLSTERRKKKSYSCEAFDKIFHFINQKGDNNELKQSFYNRICQAIFVNFNDLATTAFKEIYNNMRNNYFDKWGMWNIDIKKELSYFHQEIYKKIQSDESDFQEEDLILRAKENFILDILKRGSCALWGAGLLGEQLLERLHEDNVEIPYVFDSNSEKWGTYVAGKRVEKFCWEKIEHMLVTTPKYYEEIKAQIGNEVHNIYNLQKEIYMHPIVV